MVMACFYTMKTALFTTEKSTASKSQGKAMTLIPWLSKVLRHNFLKSYSEKFQQKLI